MIADLALVQREAGERVAIVEADFRRPSQARVLASRARPGFPEVLAGALTLGEALQGVPAAQPEPLATQPHGGFETATMLAARDHGAVALLPSRAAAVNPPALLASAEMHELLHALSQDYDRVLIDVPSPLEVSDAMPLLAAVDAIVLVARAGHTHERSARRLWQLLSNTPSAPILGVVANGITPREMQQYGISTGSGGRQGWKARLTRAMNAPQMRLPGGAADWHPAVRGRRINEGLAVALAGLACVGVALGIALAMPKPNYPLVIGGIVGLVALAALVTSPRLELTVGGLVFFLGCLNGPLKLLSSTGRVGSAIQDVLIIAILVGMAIRHMYSGKPWKLPPLAGLAIAFVAVVAIEAFNPKTLNVLKVGAGFREQLQFVPFFIFGWLLVRSKERLRKMLILVGVIALANGLVATYQTRLSPKQAAAWGEGYAAKFEGKAPVSTAAKALGVCAPRGWATKVGRAAAPDWSRSPGSSRCWPQRNENGGSWCCWRSARLRRSPPDSDGSSWSAECSQWWATCCSPAEALGSSEGRYACWS